MTMNQKPLKIVLTGAPSSGKSSTMRELQRVFGGQVALVPESAVVLLSGGFPAPQHVDVEQIRAFQKAILQVQAGLEQIIPRQNPLAKVYIFDRGSLDGAGFWPLGAEDFLKQFGLTRQNEFAKFDHVLFMELPSPEAFGGVNQLRFHDYQQSKQSEDQLRETWGSHPGFKEIKAQATLEEKTSLVVGLVRSLLNKA